MGSCLMCIADRNNGDMPLIGAYGDLAWTWRSLELEAMFTERGTATQHMCAFHADEQRDVLEAIGATKPTPRLVHTSENVRVGDIVEPADCFQGDDEWKLSVVVDIDNEGVWVVVL